MHMRREKREKEIWPVRWQRSQTRYVNVLVAPKKKKEKEKKKKEDNHHANIVKNKRKVHRFYYSSRWKGMPSMRTNPLQAMKCARTPGLKKKHSRSNRKKKKKRSRKRCKKQGIIYGNRMKWIPLSISWLYRSCYWRWRAARVSRYGFEIVFLENDSVSWLTKEFGDRVLTRQWQLVHGAFLGYHNGFEQDLH